MQNSSNWQLSSEFKASNIDSNLSLVKNTLGKQYELWAIQIPLQVDLEFLADSQLHLETKLESNTSVGNLKGKKIEETLSMIQEPDMNEAINAIARLDGKVQLMPINKRFTVSNAIIDNGVGQEILDTQNGVQRMNIQTKYQDSNANIQDGKQNSDLKRKVKKKKSREIKLKQDKQAIQYQNNITEGSQNIIGKIQKDLQQKENIKSQNTKIVHPPLKKSEDKTPITIQQSQQQQNRNIQNFTKEVDKPEVHNFEKQVQNLGYIKDSSATKKKKKVKVKMSDLIDTPKQEVMLDQQKENQEKLTQVSKPIKQNVLSKKQEKDPQLYQSDLSRTDDVMDKKKQKKKQTKKSNQPLQGIIHEDVPHTPKIVQNDVTLPQNSLNQIKAPPQFKVKQDVLTNGNKIQNKVEKAKKKTKLKQKDAQQISSDNINLNTTTTNDALKVQSIDVDQGQLPLDIEIGKQLYIGKDKKKKRKATDLQLTKQACQAQYNQEGQKKKKKKHSNIQQI